MRKVIFLFGVNGSGKSTLARFLSGWHPEAKTVGSSDVLRHALGGYTREQLEDVEPTEKHSRLRSGLLRTFADTDNRERIICDMHLAVAIRQSGRLRYEYMWDEAYEPYVHLLCYVHALPADIAERHRADALSGKRVRHLTLADIEESSQANLDEFRRLFAGRPEAHVIDNAGEVNDAAAQLRNLL